MNITSERSGRAVRTLTGYEAFVPNPLPPNPPITIDSETQFFLSAADRKLGRLDGITRILPNPDLFLAMYVKKEAVLSSQIEGTQASLVDVLDVPVEGTASAEKKSGVEDVVNYVRAMNRGLEMLDELPLSLRLIREIHAILLQGVRGSDRNPGEFRTSQNWIGPPGCTITDATFVPPPADEMLKAMGDLELFFYDSSELIPPLIKIALIHAQFETIHPFLDGNGRIGRLLITFWLCQQEILSKPLLYLSYYFKQNRAEYYDRLMDVRLKGDWENWIKFFLKGVETVSEEAVDSAASIIRLKDEYSRVLMNHAGGNNHQKLLDYLFETPVITRKEVTEKLSISSPTAGELLDTFCAFGILDDLTPEKQRNKKYSFGRYISILEKGTEQIPVS